jgi:hypothetical protein
MRAKQPSYCRGVIIATLAFALLAPLTTWAQDAQGVSDANPQKSTWQDPPGRVARLDAVEGSVTFQPAGEEEWLSAALNRPLVTGDSLWADEESRAEIHIGSTALRLGSKTEISLLDLGDRATQIRLAQGSLIVKVRKLDDDESYEVDTPHVAFTITQPGDYRLDVDPDGNQTEVAVWSGRGVADGGGSSHTIAAGQHAIFTGSDRLSYSVGSVPDRDGLDTWASGRDQNEDQSDSANYVSREMTGYEDLDDYGDWSYVEGYGECWQPRTLEVGWQPYRFGYWTWVGPWGWTWVENEPWGFAPFHYGRWAYAGARWVWVPGPAGARPVYAPALVAWVGGGPGSNFAFSFGAGVGWFPLAPGEVFVPGYRVSRAYVSSVNLTNTRVEGRAVTNFYNASILNHGTAGGDFTYANRGVPGAMTVVSRETFAGGRPVAANVVSVPAKELAAAPVSHMVAVEPVRSGVFGAGTAAANRPPATAISRSVVALRTPPLSSQQPLVRRAVPGQQRAATRAASSTSTPTTSMQNGFHTIGETGIDSQAKPKARVVWEEQGSSEPEKSADSRPEGRNSQSSQSQSSRSSTQRQAQQPARRAANPATPARRDEQLHKDDEQKNGSPQPAKPTQPQQRRASSASSHQNIPAKK